MSNITRLTGWDKWDLADIAGLSIGYFIENYENINRIAIRLCRGINTTAFRDILDRGITELLSICDMDEEVNKDAA